MKTGCSTCTIILRSIVDNPEHVDSFWGGDHERIVVHRSQSSLRVEVVRTRSIFEILRVENNVEPTGCNAFPAGNFVSMGTNTEEAFRSCRQWIRNCVDTHPVCKTIPSTLPRRVIDIGHNEDNTFSPFLHESTNQIAPYAALSHCWGSTQIIITTLSTLLAHKTHVPFSSLSKTFQDALKITYKLGLRYIWIDSLCIIQDSLADWEIESQKMASIYRNSTVTICAAKSKDGNGGCFVEGPRTTTLKQLDAETNCEIVVQVRKCPSHEGFEDTSFFHITNNLPLFARAWTFQEELLATRILYYCPEEIVFQCKTDMDCQCGEISSSLAGQKSVTVKRQFQNSFLDKSDIRKVQFHWCRVIKQYSARFLTKESDRLPALSGLSSVFADQGLGRFIAGLWTNDLPLWLTWEVFGSRISDEGFVAPSWSWMSIRSGNQIHYPLLDGADPLGDCCLDDQLSILDIGCETSSRDPFGAMKSGHLVVKGRTVRAELVYKYTPEIGLGGSLVALPPFAVRSGGKEIDFGCDCSDRVLERTTEGQDVRCLFVGTMRRKAYFLVLVSKGEEEEYLRIGIGVEETIGMKDGESAENEGDEHLIARSWFSSAEELEMKLI